MSNGDEASPSIILAGLALLVKMLITLNRVVHSVQNFFTSVMFRLMFVHYTFSSVWVAWWPPFGK